MGKQGSEWCVYTKEFNRSSSIGGEAGKTNTPDCQISGINEDVLRRWM